MKGEQKLWVILNDNLETLRARVEERRRSGLYPPGLEHELDVHFRHIAEHRPVRNLDALRQAMARFEEGLVFDTSLIATTSRLPGGETLHRSVARLVGRQTAGIVQQLRDFAEAVRVILWTMVSTFDDPTHVRSLFSSTPIILPREGRTRVVTGCGAPPCHARPSRCGRRGRR